jgi:hypothetical protein
MAPAPEGRWRRRQGSLATAAPHPAGASCTGAGPSMAIVSGTNDGKIESHHTARVAPGGPAFLQGSFDVARLRPSARRPMLRSPKRKLRETGCFSQESYSLSSRLGLLRSAVQLGATSKLEPRASPFLLSCRNKKLPAQNSVTVHAPAPGAHIAPWLCASV